MSISSRHGLDLELDMDKIARGLLLEREQADGSAGAHQSSPEGPSGQSQVSGQGPDLELPEGWQSPSESELVGTLVRLRSGGPRMTVLSISADGLRVSVAWFVRGEEKRPFLYRDSFPVAALRPVEDISSR